MKPTRKKSEILGAGFELRPTTPVGLVTAPENLIAFPGDTDGEVDLAWDPVRGRTSYIGQWASDPRGPWTEFHVGTRSSCTARGLTPGVMCYFRMCAVGPLGPGPWSDIAQKRAS